MKTAIKLPFFDNQHPRSIIFISLHLNSNSSCQLASSFPIGLGCAILSSDQIGGRDGETSPKEVHPGSSDICTFIVGWVEVRNPTSNLGNFRQPNLGGSCIEMLPTFIV